MFDRMSPRDDSAFGTLISRGVYQAAKIVYYLFFRAFLYVRCALQAGFEAVFRAPHVTLPPPLLRYKVSESLNPRLFLDVGQEIAASIERALNSAGVSLADMTNVLDFGCGCGRTIRWFTARFPHTRFYGTDIDAESIQWCQAHLGARFCINGETPPLPFPDAALDCIYAVSVFTHLDEQHQLQWLSEFHRILRPAGWLLVSLHGEGTLGNLDGHDILKLREQGILFKRSSKMRGIHPDFYQTAFQTREYVSHAWSAYFEIFLYQDCGLGYQDLVVLRPKDVAGASLHGYTASHDTHREY